MHPGERFNSISHLIGAVFAVAGTALLVVMASLKGDPWKIASFSIYGATLTALYLSSTLYHSLRGKAREVFQKLDHTAIYLLIAGTYTPFTLVTLRGAWGWSLFGVVWGLAAAGIVIDLTNHARRRIVPLILYVLMGWLAAAAVKPLLRALPPGGLGWLLAGGLLYTGGIVFYVRGRKSNGSHGIWHVFVLGGSIAHFTAIYFYVL